VQEKFDELEMAEAELAEAQLDVRQLSAVLGPPGRVMLHARVSAAHEPVQHAAEQAAKRGPRRGDVTKL